MDNTPPNIRSKENRAAYKAYVGNLEACGKKFPINQYGKVNKSQIAKISGVERQAFNNRVLKKWLAQDVERIGLEQRVNPATAHGVRPSDASPEQSDINYSQTKIAQLERENLVLKHELSVLKKKQNEYSPVLELLVKTGRRFSL
jgi:hypothetical protein